MIIPPSGTLPAIFLENGYFYSIQTIASTKKRRGFCVEAEPILDIDPYGSIKRSRNGR